MIDRKLKILHQKLINNTITNNTSTVTELQKPAGKIFEYQKFEC